MAFSWLKAASTAFTFKKASVGAFPMNDYTASNFAKVRFKL